MILMTERLRAMMNKISQSAESQSAASEELATVSEITGRNVQQQYTLIDQVTVAIEQMQATSADMASQTVNAADSANTAKNLVEQGE